VIGSRVGVNARENPTGMPSSELPQYAKPPVVEVAISVQFNPLVRFQPVHFGLLWERLRARYPITEHYPPLGSVVEVFGAQALAPMMLHIESVPNFPVGRCWYLTEDRQRVVQVQPDRFILNWRKLHADT